MHRSIAVVAALVFAGCAYGFAGGGLPPELKTVAVLPFENRTSDPTMAQEANREVRDAVRHGSGFAARPRPRPTWWFAARSRDMNRTSR
jgi:hypothetical protein